MSCVSKEVSAKIVNMSLLGALLVVSIHCGYSTADSGVCKLVHQVFSGGYSRIAVPFFFLVSGYFLAAHIDVKSWWRRETFKRFKSLIVPFFAWALLYEVLFIPLSVIADYRAGRPFGTNICFLNGNILQVFGLQWDQWPAAIPLWFLRSLFLFVIVSPLLVRVLRRIPILWLVSLYLVSLLMIYAPDPDKGGYSGFFNHVFSISGLFYFSAGMLIRIRNIHYRSRISAIVSMIVGVVLLTVNGFFAYNPISVDIPLIALAIPCLMYATWYWMPSSDLPVALRGISFPIYLAHSLFLGYWGIFAKNLLVSETITKLVAWPMAFIGSIVLSIIIRKTSPSIARVLFGGR